LSDKTIAEAIVGRFPASKQGDVAAVLSLIILCGSHKGEIKDDPAELPRIVFPDGSAIEFLGSCCWRVKTRPLFDLGEHCYRGDVHGEEWFSDGAWIARADFVAVNPSRIADDRGATISARLSESIRGANQPLTPTSLIIGLTLLPGRYVLFKGPDFLVCISEKYAGVISGLKLTGSGPHEPVLCSWGGKPAAVVMPVTGVELDEYREVLGVTK
jgi:hypothetical protein